MFGEQTWLLSAREITTSEEVRRQAVGGKLMFAAAWPVDLELSSLSEEVKSGLLSRNRK